MDERFTVVSGDLEARIAGVARRLGPGDEALAPAGAPHDWWNAADVSAAVLIELSPGRGLARFEAMIGLANCGCANAKGLPSPLQLALTPAEFCDVIQLTRPPAAVQRATFAVLGAIGRRRGLRSTYPELLMPHDTIEPDPEILGAAGLA